MTQIELKIKIENTREDLNAAIANTREDLNAAIAGNMTRSRILDISQLLDGLIEEYLETDRSLKGAGDDPVSCLGGSRTKGC